jgi:hypothetical protein
VNGKFRYTPFPSESARRVARNRQTACAFCVGGDEEGDGSTASGAAKPVVETVDPRAVHTRIDFRDGSTVALDPRAWGHLIAEEDRPRLRQACRELVDWRTDLLRGDSGAAFHLDLPDDAVLLPRILGCVIDQRHNYRGRPSETTEELLHLFGLNTKQLAPLAGGEVSTCTESKRVAAILLTMLCPDASVTDVLDEHSAYLLEAASGGNQVVHELGRCGLLVNGLALQPFRVLSSAIMRLAWENGDRGTAWEGVVVDWRQRSTAPSLTLGARDSWCK